MAGVILEVRCCCQPQKLLGWLPVPDPAAREVVFLLSNPWRQWSRITQDDQAEMPITRAAFQIATINIGERSYRAVKAEGAPIELLRRIPSFCEAP